MQSLGKQLQKAFSSTAWQKNGKNSIYQKFYIPSLLASFISSVGLYFAAFAGGFRVNGCCFFKSAAKIHPPLALSVGQKMDSRQLISPQIRWSTSPEIVGWLRLKIEIISGHRSGRILKSHWGEAVADAFGGRPCSHFANLIKSSHVFDYRELYKVIYIYSYIKLYKVIYCNCRKRHVEMWLWGGLLWRLEEC